jgi:hypothetical protein
MAIKYVRPDASHGGNNSGDSYVNAYQGWASISWAALTAGSTLYVCGLWSIAATLTPGAHGGTLASPVIITGAYAPDPGRIVFSGANFLNSTKSFTVFRELDITGGSSSLIFVQASATNCAYLYNTLRMVSSSAISFSVATGQNHADILIEGNTFLGNGGTDAGTGANLSFYNGTGGTTNSLSRLTIRNNLFSGSTAGRALIHFRGVAGTTVAMNDLVIERNMFVGTRGLCMEIKHRTDAWGVGAGVKIRFNEFENCGESLVTPGMGGCIAVDGFATSATAGFGANEVSHNVGKRVSGAVGGVNAFYGEYQIHSNYFEDLTTTTIDACAVLIDHGCDNCDIYGNVAVRAFGKPGVFNSGFLLMLLDSVNCRFYGNVGYDLKGGLLIGTPLPNQAGCWFANNAFVNCLDFGCYLGTLADRANVAVRNNIFTGAGVSVLDTVDAWTLESHNCFFGMAAPVNHTMGANDITASPMFLDAAQPWIGLRSDSPCIGKGTYLPKARDVYGYRFGQPQNIGPFAWANIPPRPSREGYAIPMARS